MPVPWTTEALFTVARQGMSTNGTVRLTLTVSRTWCNPIDRSGLGERNICRVGVGTSPYLVGSLVLWNWVSTVRYRRKAARDFS
jgi:hypothetical protein